MPRKPLVRTRPGFSPAAGFPDPEAPRPPTLAQANVTHMPHSNGTVCGMRLTHAGNYTVNRPTCTKCRDYFDAVQRTGARNPSALDAGSVPAAPELETEPG